MGCYLVDEGSNWSYVVDVGYYYFVEEGSEWDYVVDVGYFVLVFCCFPFDSCMGVEYLSYLLAECSTISSRVLTWWRCFFFTLVR